MVVSKRGDDELPYPVAAQLADHERVAPVGRVLLHGEQVVGRRGMRALLAGEQELLAVGEEEPVDRPQAVEPLAVALHVALHGYG